MERIVDWNLGNRILLFVNLNLADKNTIYDCMRRKGKKLLLKNNDLYIWDGQVIFYNCNNSKAVKDIQTGDILSVSENGYISVLNRAESEEVDIFVTNKCNSNCVMCPLSESVRMRDNTNRLNWIKEYIDLLPSDMKFICITGGEPTIIKNDFFELMQIMKDKFQHSQFQLLTNGRSSADVIFLDKLLLVCPSEIRFCIPIHASDPVVHDTITKSKGSFAQSDYGVKNLLERHQKVELRIVISKYNVEYLTDTAKYIVQNYKGVFCVNFIGMEMMGNAAINRNSLWIDYGEAFKKSIDGINILVRAGIDVQLYNFPLCYVDRGYWHIAAKSITGYKVRFMNECDSCTVKNICGGFFYSTKNLMKPNVYPVRNYNEI